MGFVADTTLAPSFDIEIEGQSVGDGINRFIRHVEYESADGLADMARLRCVNPEAIISKAKVFQPGNEMSVYAGWGKKQLEHLGRVIIVKQTPNFPQADEPTVEIVGYTKDTLLMDNSPEKSQKRRFKDSRYSDAVEDRATDEAYKMEVDIDPTKDDPHNFIQKAGLSDYDFIKGLANITGYVFWVDGTAGTGTQVWTLHFRDPDKLVEQEKDYTFNYDDGDNSTLLSFTPELLITGAKTKIAVVVKDTKTGRVIKTEIEEENNQAPDVDAAGDLNGDVQGEFTSASDIKLFFGDYSFSIHTGRKFTSEADAIRWAQQWYRRQRENFILSRGRTIGLENLRARQTHNITGVSDSYDGKYYYTKVKHVLNDSVGYICDFNARKVVP